MNAGEWTVEVLADGMGFTEGAVVQPDGRIALVSMDHGCVYIIDPADGSKERIEVGGGVNGLAQGPDGALYIAQNGGIFYGVGPAEPGVQVVRDGVVDYLATGMGAPNDLVFGPDGRLWVTDTRAEIDVRDPSTGVEGWIWACTLDGQVEAIITNGPMFTNGLGFAADGTLLVTGTLNRELWAFDVSGATAPRLLHNFAEGWPDGLAVDGEGRILVATTAANRIDVFAPDGDRLGAIDLPPGSIPTNVCVSDEAEVFVTASRSGALLRARRS